MWLGMASGRIERDRQHEEQTVSRGKPASNGLSGQESNWLYSRGLTIGLVFSVAVIVLIAAVVLVNTALR
jgi:hypothetical protein